MANWNTGIWLDDRVYSFSNESEIIDGTPFTIFFMKIKRVLDIKIFSFSVESPYMKPTFLAACIIGCKTFKCHVI